MEISGAMCVPEALHWIDGQELIIMYSVSKWGYWAQVCDTSFYVNISSFYNTDNDDHSSFKVTSELDGPVNFQTFFCIGTERRLIDCPHDDYATNEHSYCARNITRDNMHMYYYMYATAECSES